MSSHSHHRMSPHVMSFISNSVTIPDIRVFYALNKKLTQFCFRLKNVSKKFLNCVATLTYTHSLLLTQRKPSRTRANEQRRNSNDAKRNNQNKAMAHVPVMCFRNSNENDRAAGFCFVCFISDKIPVTLAAGVEQKKNSPLLTHIHRNAYRHTVASIHTEQFSTMDLKLTNKLALCYRIDRRYWLCKLITHALLSNSNTRNLYMHVN